MIGRDEGVLTCVCGRHSGPPELCRLLPCLKCDRSYFEQTEKSKRFPAVASSHRQTLPVVSRQTHQCGLLQAEPHSVGHVSLMFQHQLWMRQTRSRQIARNALESVPSWRWFCLAFCQLSILLAE